MPTDAVSPPSAPAAWADKSPLRLLVVGAGSTGGYFGGRLAAAGRDVTFLVRPRRAQQLRETGLQLISPNGDATIQPQLVTAEELSAPYDLVLLTVKAFQLEAAMTDLTRAVGKGTMILPVLNGLSHMDALMRRFGAEHVIGGVLKVATKLDEQGRIVQLTPLQELAYGELDGSVSPRLQAVDHFMQAGGFKARLSPVIQREMWEKWILLSSLGGITCLMRGSIGEVEAAPGGHVFANHLIDEIVAIVRAVGEPPSEAFLTAARAQLTTKGSPSTSSMYRDLQQGFPIESEQIIGDLLRRGQKANVPAPLLATVYAQLCVYENARVQREGGKP
jgi:2-dehydropantoate 2-reductase